MRDPLFFFNIPLHGEEIVTGFYLI